MLEATPRFNAITQFSISECSSMYTFADLLYLHLIMYFMVIYFATDIRQIQKNEH